MTFMVAQDATGGLLRIQAVPSGLTRAMRDATAGRLSHGLSHVARKPAPLSQERLVLKTVESERAPWVRIPPPPLPKRSSSRRSAGAARRMGRLRRSLRRTGRKRTYFGQAFFAAFCWALKVALAAFCESRSAFFAATCWAWSAFSCAVCESFNAFFAAAC
jgi:hypothetical protein